jgi:hypothetical protein
VGTSIDLFALIFKRLYLRFEDGEAILAAFFFEFKGLLYIFKSLVIEINLLLDGLSFLATTLEGFTTECC